MFALTRHTPLCFYLIGLLANIARWLDILIGGSQQNQRSTVLLVRSTTIIVVAVALIFTVFELKYGSAIVLVPSLVYRAYISDPFFLICYIVVYHRFVSIREIYFQKMHRSSQSKSRVR